MSIDQEQRLIFDEVAQIYDQVRPSYPNQLVKDLQEFTKITAKSKLLEIGCGTGQATKLFSQMDCSILCIEPGKNLAQIAQNNCVSFDKVRVENTTFEEWPLEAEAFQLIYSAQAFHWIQPKVRFKKTFEALVPKGVLAVFWNRPQKGTSNLDQLIQKIYSEMVPDLKTPLTAGGNAAEEKTWEDQFDESGRFETVYMSRYLWQREYRAEEYIKLMETQSDHRILPHKQRDQLFQALRQKIEECGGSYKINYVTRAYFARRKEL